MRRTLASLLAAVAALAATPGGAQPSVAAAEARPIRGPWKPDLPLAKAYDASARALAMADDNPLFANCQRAVRERLKDGTWQAW